MFRQIYKKTKTVDCFTLVLRFRNVQNQSQSQKFFTRRRINRTYCRSKLTMVDMDAVKYLEIPNKSENDKKQYKTFKLANGMLAMIVSDPSPVPHDGLTTSSEDSVDDNSGSETSSSSSEEETEGDDSDSDSDSEEGDEKLAACALLVNVGSFTDPQECQGLSHFLEHMIFMGSEKFPKENAFDAHVKKSGGFDNANTDCEETLFYFEVAEKHLDSTMEIFSALLESPLMKKEAMTRERDAVESEFQITQQDDEARRDQLLASLSTPGYPNGIFTWGNSQTLKDNVDDDDLYKTLHEFRKRHYSAHRMMVCVQARLPIEELEGLVVKHFAKIPSNHIDGEDFTKYSYSSAFSDSFYNNVYFLKPVENTCKLELTWCLPPMLKLYKCKPDHFLSYLIGYEGEGSLCAYLRKRLWALELIAGVDDSGFDTNSIYSLFNLCIYLTKDGFNNLKEVLAATFAYIKLFAQSESLEAAYNELKLIEETSFRFESQKPAFDNVQNLVVKMKSYPPKDILTGTELYFEYNEQQIRNVIEHLNQFKFNIMITSQEKYPGIVYDQKEKWFGTEYTSIPIPVDWIQLWDNSKTIPELFLPLTNKFIATDFRILWKENGEPEIPQIPKKILQTDICELWFRQDDKFHLPEALMYFYFISPLPHQSPKFDVLMALYSQLVKYRLSEELYPATVAGLNYEFYASDKGIALKVSGYNEKLHLLVDIITKAMVSMRDYITDNQLNVFKHQQSKEFFNTLIKPSALNKDIRLCVLENIRWPMVDKHKCLPNITLSDILEFADNFTKQLYVQALMQGNLVEESAHNVMNSVMTTLNCQRINELKYIESRTVQLPQGSHFIRCNALNDKDVNTIVCNFYQIGPCSLRMESILDLLMMFVEEPLFDNLRTKEQLGYHVSASMKINFGIAGYSITVNSQETSCTAQHVDERIEAFRSQMLQILEEMDDDEYLEVRESLIKIKQVVDTSLIEEVTRNWGEISCEEYLFDRRRKEIEIIKTITKQDIIEFCLNNERTNLRKLSVQVIGNKPNEKNADSTVQSDDNKDIDLFDRLSENINLIFLPRDGDATTVCDINEFKGKLFVYPVTKTKVDSIDQDENKLAPDNANSTKIIG